MLRRHFLALRHYSSVITFVAGFLFDIVTMSRIDAWLNLASQVGYLAGLTGLLVYQHREITGRWAPGRLIARLWHYNVEALHFLLGGLLSAYVVLYFRSTSSSRAVLFLLLLVIVMVMNEVPRVRSAGYRLRIALYAFCVLSFLSYFIPIIVGRINQWIFLLSLLLSGAIVWWMTRWLEPDADRVAERRGMFAPAAGVLVFIGALYVLRLIPPVPLSVQFQGIYHDVRRDSRGFSLVYEAPPFWAVWRHDSRPFERRDGDRLHYFVRVFAPSGFRHSVVIRWDLFEPARGSWMTTDRVVLDVVGGREDGFRGAVVKSNFMPGRWRVSAETEDGRALATLTFSVEEDTTTGERLWRTLGA
ncbi:MAG TPA: DUF2914 domain-containing protein [Vicinamibacterales bacterium]